MLFVFFCGVFIGCDDMGEPVKDYLEEYGSRAMIKSATAPEGSLYIGEVVNAPSDNDFCVTLNLKNDRGFVFKKDNGISFQLDSFDKKTALELFGEDKDLLDIAIQNITVLQTSDTSIDINFPKVFLQLCDTGFDITPTFTLCHPTTKVEFQTITPIHIKCNTPPPTASAAIYKGDASYMLCFSLLEKAKIGIIHSDIAGLIIDKEMQKEETYPLKVQNGVLSLVDVSSVTKGLPPATFKKVAGDEPLGDVYYTPILDATQKEHTVCYIDKGGLTGKMLTLEIPEEHIIPPEQLDAVYKVEHYIQDTDLVNYSLKSTQNKTAPQGSPATYTALTDIAGFVFDHDNCPQSVAQDGSTTVKVYYTRKDITLTFALDNGSPDIVITGKYGTNITAPASPVKTGYNFRGWQIADGTQVLSSLPDTFPATNVNYCAVWGEANSYTITYDLNDDPKDRATNSATNPATYTIKTPTITFEPATRTGYTFCGWYTSKSTQDASTKITTIATGTTGNKTLFAKWQAVTVTLTFNLQGGIVSPQQTGDTFTLQGEYRQRISLKAPTKDGYIFKGWSPSLPATFPATPDTYTATWQKKIVFYVDSPNGLDTNEGTKAAPLATAQEAIRQIMITNAQEAGSTYIVYIEGNLLLNETISIKTTSSTSLELSIIGENNAVLSAAPSKNINILSVQGTGLKFTAQDLVIQKGNSASDASGVLCSAEQATFENCTIQNNSTGSSAGGLKVSAGRANFNDCTIKDNSSCAEGGGIYIDGGDATFNGCIIEGNICNTDSSGDSGAGVWAAGGVATFKNCTIKNNGSKNTGAGGAIYISDAASVVIDGGSITGNKADSGGAIYANSKTSSLTIKGSCEVKGNTAQNGGGGAVYVSGTKVAIKDGAKIYDNSAVGYGSDIYVSAGDNICLSGEVTIKNNSASNNCVYLQKGSGTKQDAYIEVSSSLAQGSYVAIKPENKKAGTIVLKAANGLSIDSSLCDMFHLDATTAGDFILVPNVAGDCGVLKEKTASVQGSFVINEGAGYTLTITLDTSIARGQSINATLSAQNAQGRAAAISGWKLTLYNRGTAVPGGTQTGTAISGATSVNATLATDANWPQETYQLKIEFTADGYNFSTTIDIDLQ